MVIPVVKKGLVALGAAAGVGAYVAANSVESREDKIGDVLERLNDDEIITNAAASAITDIIENNPLEAGEEKRRRRRPGINLDTGAIVTLASDTFNRSPMARKQQALAKAIVKGKQKLITHTALTETLGNARAGAGSRELSNLARVLADSKIIADKPNNSLAQEASRGQVRPGTFLRERWIPLEAQIQAQTLGYLARREIGETLH